MISSNTSTILFLLLFVSFYVICLCTYTYISSLTDVHVKEIRGENKIRVKRIAQTSDGDIDENNYWIDNITLNKCCAEKQYLNQRYQCEDEDNTILNDRLLNKLTFYIIDDNFNKISVNMQRVNFDKLNYILNLRDENAFAVNWNAPTLKERYAFSQEDLSLLELNDNKTKVVKTFSTASFCLDFLSSERVLVAYINPCLEKVCIQKCCPKYNYYNFIEEKCVYDKNIPEYIPTFYIDIQQIGTDLPYYFTKRNLQCATPEIIRKFQVDHLVPNLYIQEDGKLRTVDEEIQQKQIYQKSHYCIDQFSDGTVEDAIVNGLVCQSSKKKANTGPFSAVLEPTFDEGFDFGEESIRLKTGKIRKHNRQGNSLKDINSNSPSRIMAGHPEERSNVGIHSKFLIIELTGVVFAIILYL